jgi:bifunctional non-homologous end joining protein LigD
VSSGAGAPRRRPEAAPEPLPLTLPAPPPLPGHIHPEAAVPCSEAFDDGDWRFSIDWDGARALLFAGAGGEIHLQSAAGAELASRFPEIGAAAAAISRRPVILDGVIATLDGQGRPDLEAFGRRLAIGAGGAATAPVVYLASDVLHLDGTPTLAWPLDRRLEALPATVAASDTIQLPDHVAGRGTALAEAAVARGLSALVARRGDAPYRAGVASPQRLRIALTNHVTCVVLGVEGRTHAAGRLVLGEFVAGRLALTARVPGPREPAVERWLQACVRELATALSPLDSGAWSDGVVWLRPALTATVAYGARSADGTLRDASLIAVRDDVEPRWCVRREAVAPPNTVDVRGRFVPTILLPLPLDEAALIPHPRR